MMIRGLDRFSCWFQFAGMRKEHLRRSAEWRGYTCHPRSCKKWVKSRGVHQYLSDNVNAFLPGTYDPSTGTGVRPNGINENIYQFQSGSVYNQNQLTTAGASMERRPATKPRRNAQSSIVPSD